MLRLAATEMQESPGLPSTFWKQADLRWERDSIAKAGGTPRPVTMAPETEGRYGTEFRRSWLVMLLFAGGIGLAPWAERKLRPVDYPNSETYRNDIILTVVTVLTLISACVIARMHPNKETAPVEARP